MERYTESWKSITLNAEAPIAVYGHYGPAVLFFPFDGEDYLSLERGGIIERVAPMLDAGRLKIFTIGSIDRETWLSDEVPNRRKALRHQQYNRYITEEVVPFIDRNMRSTHPTIYTGGISVGAIHALNSFLRRPDIFEGVFGFSSTYDLKSITNGYFDNDVYFNSPVDFLPHLIGPALTNLRQKHRLLLVSGSGEDESPEATRTMGELLEKKGISNWVDIWGEEFGHTWEAWRTMVPIMFERNF